MKYLRPSEERGHADHGWLNSKHSFSFAEYFDPAHMGFGPLRVINEDKVAPGRGFGAHPHKNMEIISYVVEGGLEHRDSMGQVSVIKPGDVQRMSAGTGVLHSEYNASKTDPVHFLQIWILPSEQGLEPSYAQGHFDDLNGKLRLVAAPDAREGAIGLNADVDLYASRLPAGDDLKFDMRPGRVGWIQVIKGSLFVDGEGMKSGDGMAFKDEPNITIAAHEESEFLLFDMEE